MSRPTRRERLGALALRAAQRLSGGHPILLEYPPPDQTRMRWGWGSPPNLALHDLLVRNADRYRATIELIERYGSDLARIPLLGTDPGEPYWGQDYFTGVDAAALYSLIRVRRPSRYHEVGSGNSTLFAARAIRDGGLPTRILSVDPAPRADVDLVCDEVIRVPLEQADPSRVAALEAGDVLLVDSSHCALTNSDVVTFFLDVLPALPGGVLVGIHDVFLPDDYPWWLGGRWYSEQYLLAAWLLGAGDRVRLAFASHFCATEPTIRVRLDAAWDRASLPRIAYGSSLWLET
ncbi:MAG: class I SAM-dependent methyltransferase [Solirubrobacterales bacterium]|nr:MAG: class I SAM-dependent methyltransferase [Solirubrobacterales bacterium]